jgi:2-dehydro-3-deoxyphosphogluconate aldolase/(4S)-4-hydroxy-2-oxoglutarate aldolase
MGNSQEIYERIADGGIVAGMRGPFGPETALTVVDTLVAEGITVFEFTMNSEEPIAAMQAVKEKHGDAIAAGMGTVLSVNETERVLDAGADFVVSPAFQPSVVRTVVDAGVLMAPGVATPSEAVAAWEMGVPLLKVFPIGPLGINYFKAMFGPLAHMKFMCNGGINHENARAFVQAGAVAVGAMGWLTGSGSSSVEAIQSRARLLKAAIHRARTGDTTVRA